MWLGFRDVEVLPSPKFQDQAVMPEPPFEERSVNGTVSGTLPEVASAEKSTSGAAGVEVTWTYNALSSWSSVPSSDRIESTTV